jgi:integrase
VSFAGACAEYLRYIEHDLDRKPSTLCDYRSVIRAHLLPAFGSLRLEDVTSDRIEAWKGTLRTSNRTKVKLLTVLNGIMTRARRVHRLPVNPMADIEKPRHRRSTAIEVFSPEEVLALVRVADSEQDAAIYLTAAFTGLRRGELSAGATSTSPHIASASAAPSPAAVSPHPRAAKSVPSHSRRQ